ncbi:hypothetical protein SKAU_G00247780 [Synaphobranchus kaupii]|uniref:Uncharacterized protein n=1 Tax=Synaphobranchus kaupii TaxID=118154 RepID=A0A9Q1F291_SYNKA|nr:hypothetical protein SKAU_G00247780 [Synaphobranchus kaupii]
MERKQKLEKVGGARRAVPVTRAGAAEWETSGKQHGSFVLGPTPAGPSPAISAQMRSQAGIWGPPLSILSFPGPHQRAGGAARPADVTWWPALPQLGGCKAWHLPSLLAWIQRQATKTPASVHL